MDQIWANGGRLADLVDRDDVSNKQTLLLYLSVEYPDSHKTWPTLLEEMIFHLSSFQHNSIYFLESCMIFIFRLGFDMY